MASTLQREGLDPNAPARPPGHGTTALGPSDSSDSGSDVAHGPGFGADELQLRVLDGGTTSEGEEADVAGADIGDADLSSDSDSGGTGERASAGRDTVVVDGADIAPDRIIDMAELQALDHEFDDAIELDDERDDDEAEETEEQSRALDARVTAFALERDVAVGVASAPEPDDESSAPDASGDDDVADDESDSDDANADALTADASRVHATGAPLQ